MTENKPYILIIDDNEDAREILRRIVVDIGFSAQLARNGREALKIVEEQLPTLVLLDLMMPEMNGYEFLLGLKQTARSTHTPVVIVSSVSKSMSPRDTNIVGIIEKAEFSVNEMSTMIKELIAGLEPDNKNNGERGASASQPAP